VPSKAFTLGKEDGPLEELVVKHETAPREEMESVLQIYLQDEALQPIYQTLTPLPYEPH
jgi:hypothetical protein